MNLKMSFISHGLVQWYVYIYIYISRRLEFHVLKKPISATMFKIVYICFSIWMDFAVIQLLAHHIFQVKFQQLHNNSSTFIGSPNSWIKSRNKLY